VEKNGGKKKKKGLLTWKMNGGERMTQEALARKGAIPRMGHFSLWMKEGKTKNSCSAQNQSAAAG